MSNKILRAQQNAHDAVLKMCSETYNAALEFDQIIVQSLNRRIEGLRIKETEIAETIQREIAELEYMRDEAKAGIIRITKIVGADNQPKELEDHTNVNETTDES